jgi:hypothetical protein
MRRRPRSRRSASTRQGMARLGRLWISVGQIGDSGVLYGDTRQHYGSEDSGAGEEVAGPIGGDRDDGLKGWSRAR